MPTATSLPHECPSAEVLLAFAKGSLSPDRVVEIERHIASCAICSGASDTVLLKQPLRLTDAAGDVSSDVQPNESATTLPLSSRSTQTLRRVGQHTDDKVLASRYRLGAFIAKGGMGAVHRATDQLFRREVAVKLLLGSQEGEERAPPPSGAGNVTVESRPSASYV